VEERVHLPEDDEGRHSTSADGTGSPTLTARERQVLALSATGHGVAEVAAILALPPDAVRGSLASAVARLGARSKLEAVVLALRTRQIEPDAP
jgi:DNA-binding CsgD family transcriptional regulator